MAINISNIGTDWFVKLYREEWFFKDVDEFTPVFVFFLEHGVGFNCSVKSGGFSVMMVDANLKPVDYPNMIRVATQCLAFKKQFGDKTRLNLIIF